MKFTVKKVFEQVLRQQTALGDENVNVPKFYITHKDGDDTDPHVYYSSFIDVAKDLDIELTKRGSFAVGDEDKIINAYFFQCSYEDAQRIAAKIPYTVRDENEQVVRPLAKPIKKQNPKV